MKITDKHQDNPLRTKYDRPAIVRHTHTLKLGEPRILVLEVAFSRDVFHPNRLVTNMPWPDIIRITDIEWGRNPPQFIMDAFIGAYIDASQFHHSQQGVGLALPTLTRGEIITLTAEYTGNTPPGFKPDSEVDLVFMWAEPGVGIAFGNYQDIGENPKVSIRWVNAQDSTVEVKH
jgi:hypothetical protein